MEFPASQLQAGVALTMFSPDVVPALYGQLNSEQSTNRNRGRDTRKSIGEGDSELHEHGGKSNLKKLGDLFKRKPYGSLSRSSRTAIQRSHEEQEASYLRELGPPQILSLEDSAYPEDTWATFIEADSEISHNKRLGTLEIEKRNDDPESSGRFRSHQRGKSFHVNFTPDDVQRIAKEIYDQTIADVHLSLFSYWINESEEHYEEAKRHIRELRLDHGYNLARIANVHLRKLMQDVFDQRPVEAYIALSKKISLHDMAMATSRTPTCPLFPRIDALPRPLRVERERAVSQAVLRPVSTDSLSPPQRKYPPDTSDRPAPLSVRPSTANLRSSPSLSIGFTSSESAPPLPFGFPSPRSTLRVSNSNSPALASYTSSLYDDDKFDDEQTDKEDEGDSTWESRVADIYERVIGLERPEQLDQVIEELQGLKALYCNTPTPSPKKRS